MVIYLLFYGAACFSLLTEASDQNDNHALVIPILQKDLRLKEFKSRYRDIAATHTLRFLGMTPDASISCFQATQKLTSKVIFLTPMLQNDNIFNGIYYEDELNCGTKYIVGFSGHWSNGKLDIYKIQDGKVHLFRTIDAADIEFAYVNPDDSDVIMIEYENCPKVAYFPETNQILSNYIPKKIKINWLNKKYMEKKLSANQKFLLAQEQHTKGAIIHNLAVFDTGNYVFDKPYWYINDINVRAYEFLPNQDDLFLTYYSNESKTLSTIDGCALYSAVKKTKIAEISHFTGDISWRIFYFLNNDEVLLKSKNTYGLYKLNIPALLAAYNQQNAGRSKTEPILIDKRLCK